LAIASIALILAGVIRYLGLEIRIVNRPLGSWEEIRGLASRDDLNLVFVLIDTLRADRLSAFGYDLSRDPPHYPLSAWASGGVREPHGAAARCGLPHRGHLA
jgi:hypothetical protein